MQHFDFHHHNSSQEHGIYNLKYEEELPTGLFSAGIHPDSVEDYLEEKMLWLHKVAQAENCVAIGECGLDGRFATDALQEEVFRRQILLANQLQKPLIIHCVKRFPALIRFKKSAKVPMIIHGFNKRETIGRELLMHNFYLSFGKSLLYNVDLQGFLKDIPSNRFFLETDSADVDLQEIYEKAAALKNIGTGEMAEQIKLNLLSLKIVK